MKEPNESEKCIRWLRGEEWAILGGLMGKSGRLRSGREISDS